MCEKDSERQWGADLLGLFFEPLLEASLTKMLTAAISEVRFVQHLGADHTQVVIRELLHEFILRHDFKIASSLRSQGRMRANHAMTYVSCDEPRPPFL
jgi:hypothetical protein